MVNWRLSYMRCALLIRARVIFGLRPPVRPRARAAARPATVRSLMRAASYSAIRAKMPKTSLPCAKHALYILAATYDPRARPTIEVFLDLKRYRSGVFPIL